MEIKEKSVPGYERVVWGRDAAAGYEGVVVVHSTALGPAVGGTRYWHYTSYEDALTDALRLARGMTYKNALAGLPLGGGKSVILGEGTDQERTREGRQRLFRAHGKVIESLEGKYIAGEDVGTSPADMEYVLMETNHVAGLNNRSGDPSPHTARGVFRAMQAATKQQWGSDDLGGKTVAIQGCGHVGYHLAQQLHQVGANLIVSDLDRQRVERVVRDFAAQAEVAENIYAAPADIFAPCALGGILNDRTIPRLRARVVVGAANNQLLEPRHGELLEQHGILYAPDYAANAGGVIHGCSIEMLGWDPARTRERIDDTIYETVRRIFSIARAEGIATYRAADRLAEEQLSRRSTTESVPSRK
jgi:leucine dehydrogenase